MRIERTQNSIKSAFWGFLNRAINLIIPFIIRTVLIKKLGSEFLGLNSLFVSIIQILNLTELGVGSALVFNMYKPIAEDDYDKISSLLGFLKKTYRIIGFTILGLGICVVPVLHLIVDTEALNGTGINLYILYGIYLLNTVLSYFAFAYKKSLLLAYQRQDIVSNINSIANILLYLSQLVILFVVPNYYVYTILIPFFTLLDNIIIGMYVKKRFPQITDSKSAKNVEYRELFTNVKYIIGHKLGAVIIQSADSIVISIFLTLSTVTVYSNYFYIISALVGIINVGYNAILAGVGNSIITKSKDDLYKLFLNLSFILFFVVAFCSSMLLSLYQPFMLVWMGSQYLLPFKTVILFVLYFYTWQIRVILLNFKDAAGMWREDFFKPYLGIIVNILLNILLVLFIEVDGVLLATIVVMLFIYAPWETVVLHKKLFFRSQKKYVITQGLYFIATVLISAITYLVTCHISLDGICGLIIKGIVASLSTLSLLLIICFRMPEFKYLINTIKSRVNK